MSSSFSFMQDVDTAFLNKSDLEANMDALAQEADFLKALYLEVRLFSRCSWMKLLSLHAQSTESGLQVSGGCFRTPRSTPTQTFVLPVTVCGAEECQGGRRLHSHDALISQPKD